MPADLCQSAAKKQEDIFMRKQLVQKCGYFDKKDAKYLPSAAIFLFLFFTEFGII